MKYLRNWWHLWSRNSVWVPLVQIMVNMFFLLFFLQQIVQKLLSLIFTNLVWSTLIKTFHEWWRKLGCFIVKYSNFCLIFYPITKQVFVKNQDDMKVFFLWLNGKICWPTNWQLPLKFSCTYSVTTSNDNIAGNGTYSVTRIPCTERLTSYPSKVTI